MKNRIMKKIIMILLVTALVAGGMFLVHQKKLSISAASTYKVQTTVVRTAVAREGELSVTRTYLARVESWRSASVSAQIASRVMDVSVQEGDSVSKGQVLAVLDSEELLARVRGIEAGVLQSRMQADAASATIDSLKKTLRFREREAERDELLVREGAIAKVVSETTSDLLNETRGRLNAMQKTVQAAKEQIKVLERELDQARIRMAYTRIIAPFDGVVAQRLVDPGDMAGLNQALVKIEDHSRFKICFDIPQDELSSIKQGMGVVVESGPELNLSITRIHPSLNRDRTLTVECDTQEKADVWAGSTLQVAVVLNRFEAQVLIPENSLVPIPGGGEAVFIVKNGVTAAIPVMVLGRNSGMAAIQGVPSGTRVIENTYLGWNRLAAGERVEVMP